MAFTRSVSPEAQANRPEAGGYMAPPDPATAVKAFISISPFSYSCLDEDASGIPPMETAARLADRVGPGFVLTNSGRHALDLILADVSPSSEDVITIVTTSGGSYVSGCVTRTIERHCRWSVKIEDRTRAVLVIHEFGRPCEAANEYFGRYPVIEDCAYAFATRYADGEHVGRRGDYALFSLPKMFSSHFGGVARAPAGRRLGFEMPADDRDFLLGRISAELSELPSVLERRKLVWRDLRDRFARLGAEPFYEPVAGDAPAVFMFAHDPALVSLEAVRERYDAHGVEASAFWGSNAFYVPAHHRLGAGSRQYLADIYGRLLEEHGAC